MANEEQRPEGAEVPQGDEPEVNASGSAAPEDHLTVEDILDTEQNADAKAADAADVPADVADISAPDEEAAASEAENPYLEDLRRLTAEYANYRKRTEANAEIERERASAKVITPMLGVLDDFERAAKHGDLPEGSAVAAIAQKLQQVLEKQGLQSFGAVGDDFDPSQHEAIAMVPAPQAQPNTIIDVIEKGYRLGGVELRPAKVAVAVKSDG